MIIVGVIAVVLLAVAVVVMMVLTPQEAAPGPGGTTTGTIGINDPNYVPYPSGTQGGVAVSPEEAGVRTAFATKLSSGNPDEIQLQRVVVSGDYALALWAGNITSGQALVKRSGGQWAVTDLGGGTWTTETLVSLEGVPAEVAAALVAGASAQ